MQWKSKFYSLYYILITGTNSFFVLVKCFKDAERCYRDFDDRCERDFDDYYDFDDRYDYYDDDWYDYDHDFDDWYDFDWLEI